MVLGVHPQCGVTSPSLVLVRAVWTWFFTTVIDHSKGRSFWSGTGVKVRLTMARLNYVIIHWLIEWGNMCAFQKLKTWTGPKYHSLFPQVKNMKKEKFAQRQIDLSPIWLGAVSSWRRCSLPIFSPPPHQLLQLATFFFVAKFGNISELALIW